MTFHSSELRPGGAHIDVETLPKQGDHHYEGTKQAMIWLADELMRIRACLKQNFGPIHMSFGEQCLGAGNQSFLRRWSSRIKEVLEAWETSPGSKIAQAKDEIIGILNNAGLACEQRQAVRDLVIQHYDERSRS
jgi:hypothetical protein